MIRKRAYLWIDSLTTIKRRNATENGYLCIETFVHKEEM